MNRRQFLKGAALLPAVVGAGAVVNLIPAPVQAAVEPAVEQLDWEFLRTGDVWSNQFRYKMNQLSRIVTQLIQNRLHQARELIGIRIVEVPVGVDPVAHQILQGRLYDPFWYLPGLQHDPQEVLHRNKLIIPTYSVQAADCFYLRKASEERVIESVNRIASAILRYDMEGYGRFRGWHPTMVLKSSFEAHPDLTLLRKQHIGWFGWQEQGWCA